MDSGVYVINFKGCCKCGVMDYPTSIDRSEEEEDGEEVVTFKRTLPWFPYDAFLKNLLSPSPLCTTAITSLLPTATLPRDRCLRQMRPCHCEARAHLRGCGRLSGVHNDVRPLRARLRHTQCHAR